MADLKPLPRGTNPLGFLQRRSSVCPSDAPVKSFNVVALDRPMKLNPKAPDVIEVDFERKIEMTMPEGKIFALEEEAATVASNVMPNPLTLRANLGDCHQGQAEEQDEGEPGIVLCAGSGLRSERQLRA